MSASRSTGTADALGPQEPDREDSDLLAALLDGMDAALCAFDADGVVTHWNREAERILGWTAEEAVGRRGFAGWAARAADADEVETRLLSAMDTPGRQVHDFALLTKDGRRVLVRTQSAGVRAADGRPAGVYCAFSEVHTQIDLERSIALSEALFDDASWGVVLVDADLRPAVVNARAARALGVRRTEVLGRPLGELLSQGVEELEAALQHVLGEGPPPEPVELWVTLRAAGERTAGRTGDRTRERREGGQRRCWRSGFLRLGSPLAEEPVPLGVGWLFQDITEAKQAEQEAARLRFRSGQLHRADRVAAECEEPMEAVTSYMDFALAGFADHALFDLVVSLDPPRLARASATPSGPAGAPAPLAQGGVIPVPYPDGHPAFQALQRVASVRASAGAEPGTGAPQWARDRLWPEDTVHALCTVLRSRARTLGVMTFLRGPSREAFERAEAVYAESVAARVATALDAAQLLRAPTRDP
ncbi:PAS domain-containing protein [Streptomyces sp. GC420]|uniref:PAS domain-containing protein n=1 Tax=Streptomyces sp. GC420 TaxID=2697568 RepID=UPI001414EBEF|nr:PAS domain-containing protein [Streptomyces sp. GC420]NBM18987.1 PAS domain-containing protein [Streptomyces sp. GC420]